ncbi:amidohydrolase family protein [Paracoccus shanxieyensis]|uniref:Amidohydrolase family protein n=1 Tax=Paracoccus shanxieyensis TaxID=2675752 RepID=A0A6L6J4M5_9RHOB|nr:amidohydrolase family protein [Paracoccus shanxieyensis]MTH66190.1 amidohydrolase family protein [Paracoccus shanxieyensis]MTH89461.1 amidohydrolase family protein [Paracoccus shanxieyensis]
MQILDAHCHFWRLDRGDYGWLSGPGLDAIRRDFGPSDHPGDGPVIAVQAAPTLAETDFLLSLSGPVGVVGWVDLTAAHAVTDLESRAENPRFRGIRPMLQDIADTNWLLTAPRPEALAALPRLGLTFDALVTRRHLGVLAEFAARNPDLAIVIDHAAKPQPDEHSAWAQGMRALAADPRIHCKLSGLLTELAPGDLHDPLPALRPLVAHLLDWFGPQRLIWGSDWPVLNLAGSFAQWRDLTDELLRDLSAADRAAIMGGNAARFYGVTP